MKSETLGAEAGKDPRIDADFNGLRVGAFESRMAFETAQLIKNFGGVPFVAPSMREVPLEANTVAFDFAERLLAGKIDVVILLTGVGTRVLVKTVETRFPRERFIEALSKTMLVVRGPKPVAALREFGLRPTIAAPEPNTWREILPEVDRHADLKGKKVAVQEYGLPNPELIDELKRRGAHVMRVPVYRWALPEDCSGLRILVRKVCEGDVDILLFTNAVQVDHSIQIAGEEGLEDSFRESLERVVIASIGPVTTEALREQRLPVDIEAERSKIGLFVREVAARGPALSSAKKEREAPTRSPVVAAAPLTTEAEPRSLADTPFMRACRLEPAGVTPIWIMRQAGRYMKEYREVRRRVKFLDLCKSPELAAEVTVTAVEKLGVDAAIIFSDILMIVEPMGVGLEFVGGEGPLIHRPVRNADDVGSLREVDVETDLGFVHESIRKARAALPSNIPLIGFVGAPFTVVSYMVEGKSSRDYIHTKSLMYRDPGAWHALMGRVADATVRHVNAQVKAGAQAVQIFDSWVGCLSPDDYRDYVLPHMKRLVGGVKGAPVIQFGTGTASLLDLIREGGGQVIGLDWRVKLGASWARLGQVAVQGNLDPLALFADLKTLRLKVKAILDQAAGRPGHIFNLGHGVLPQTPFDHVRAVVDMVHEMSAAAGRRA